MTIQSDFLNSVKQGALDGWKKYGVLPSLTGAQAALESGWGKSVIANNLFGIKADSSWTGPVAYSRTREYGPNGFYYITAKFRAYPSYSASVLDHGKFLYDNSRYSNILGDTNYKQVCNLIQEDGYATDPNYASKLIATIEANQLYNWDEQVTGTKPNSSYTPSVPPVHPSPNAPQEGDVYTVKSGDTLSGIAVKYGMTTQELQDLNGITNPDLIYVGQVLRLSGNSQPNAQDTYTVRSGDTLSGIALQYGVTVQELQNLNGIADPNRIYVGQVLKINNSSGASYESGGATYTVQSGDALSLIAQKFGVTTQYLQDINGISDPNKIYVGQVLKIGKRSGTVSEVTTYTVQSGDALSLIAQKFGVTTQYLQNLNGISDPNKIYVGQVLKVGKSGGTTSTATTYTVKSGDALSLIAVKFDVSTAYLQALNGIADANKIYVGEVLKV